MHPVRQTADLLSREHRETLARLARVEHAVRRTPTGGPAAEADAAAEVRGLLAELDGDVGRHFDFEERELFPRMTGAGEGELAEVLAEEHLRIRAAADALGCALATARPQGEPAPGSRLGSTGEFRRLALELVERLRAHIDKEEAAFPFLLEGLLDEDADRALAAAHAQG